eukprot:tig00000803_g4322.t1
MSDGQYMNFGGRPIPLGIPLEVLPQVSDGLFNASEGLPFPPLDDVWTGVAIKAVSCNQPLSAFVADCNITVNFGDKIEGLMLLQGAAATDGYKSLADWWKTRPDWQETEKAEAAQSKIVNSGFDQRYFGFLTKAKKLLVDMAAVTDVAVPAEYLELDIFDYVIPDAFGEVVFTAGLSFIKNAAVNAPYYAAKKFTGTLMIASIDQPTFDEASAAVTCYLEPSSTPFGAYARDGCDKLKMVKVSDAVQKQTADGSDSKIWTMDVALTGFDTLDMDQFGVYVFFLYDRAFVFSLWDAGEVIDFLVGIYSILENVVDINDPEVVKAAEGCINRAPGRDLAMNPGACTSRVPGAITCGVCPDITKVLWTSNGFVAPDWILDPTSTDPVDSSVGICFPGNDDGPYGIECDGWMKPGTGEDTICNQPQNNFANETGRANCFKSSRLPDPEGKLTMCGYCKDRGCVKSLDDLSGPYDGQCPPQNWMPPSFVPNVWEESDPANMKIKSAPAFAAVPFCNKYDFEKMSEDPELPLDQICVERPSGVPPPSGTLRKTCAPCNSTTDGPCVSYYQYWPTPSAQLCRCIYGIDPDCPESIDKSMNETTVLQEYENQLSDSASASANSTRRAARRRMRQTRVRTARTKTSIFSARCDSCAVSAQRILYNLQGKEIIPDAKKTCSMYNKFPLTPSVVGSGGFCSSNFDPPATASAGVKSAASNGLVAYANNIILTTASRNSANGQRMTKAIKGVGTLSVKNVAAKTKTDADLRTFVAQCDQDMKQQDDTLCQNIVTSLLASYGKNPPKFYNISINAQLNKVLDACTPLACPNGFKDGKCAGQVCDIAPGVIFPENFVMPRSVSVTLPVTASFDLTLAQLAEGTCSPATTGTKAVLARNATLRAGVAASLYSSVSAFDATFAGLTGASVGRFVNVGPSGLVCTPAPPKLTVFATDTTVGGKNYSAEAFRGAVSRAAAAGKLLVTIQGTVYNISASEFKAGATLGGVIAPGGKAGGRIGLAKPKIGRFGNSVVNKARGANRRGRLTFNVPKDICEGLLNSDAAGFLEAIVATVTNEVNAYSNKSLAAGQLEAVNGSTVCGSVKQDMDMYPSTGADAIAAADLEKLVKDAVARGNMALEINGVTYTISTTDGLTTISTGTGTSAAPSTAASLLASLLFAVAAAFLAML